MSNYTHETVPTRFVEANGVRYACGEPITLSRNSSERTSNTSALFTHLRMTWLLKHLPPRLARGHFMSVGHLEFDLLHPAELEVSKLRIRIQE
jgi:hypothetical protein